MGEWIQQVPIEKRPTKTDTRFAEDNVASRHLEKKEKKKKDSGVVLNANKFDN